MNAKRRKQLSEIIFTLGNLRDQIDDITSDEVDYCDSIPESMYSRIEKSTDGVDNLNDALSSLDDSIDSITEAIE